MKTQTKHTNIRLEDNHKKGKKINTKINKYENHQGKHANIQLYKQIQIFSYRHRHIETHKRSHPNTYIHTNENINKNNETYKHQKKYTQNSTYTKL